MQSSSGFVPPVAHIPYPYHGVPPGPQDYDLKRQWLTLLPPPQIIEICLTFDLHVPHYVKSTIWPTDLHAAIAAMKKAVPRDNTEKNDQGPAAQVAESSEDSNAAPAQKGPASEDQPPDKPPGNSEAPATPQPAATTPSQQQQSPPPPPPPPSYPPFGYLHPHAPSAYPHNPYYPYAHGYPSYPHHGAYPPYTAGPPPSGAPPAAHPYHASPAGQPPDTYAAGVTADDLPSYEEMIVEALTDASDPEGCAPKDLFAWMATRYPLQSNFRPSASQALQKAFKRGRLEKSSGGKYRLSATWEGGNTSRRTTRRPQTQSQQTSNGHTPTTSPFTHAPLLSLPSTTTQPPYAPGPYGYGYPPHPGFPGYPPVLSQPQGQPQSQQTQAPTEGPATTEDTTAADVYEAAHNILKAINFGGLLQLASEGPPPILQDGTAAQASQDSSDPGHMDTSTTSSQLQVQPQQPYMPPIQPQPAFPPEMHAMQSSEASQISASRTELQAQLALLAAQLAEYAQMDEVIVQPQPSQAPVSAVAIHPEAQPTAVENAVTPAPVSLPPGSMQVERSTSPISGAPATETSGDQPKPKQGEGDESEDDDDMEEII